MSPREERACLAILAVLAMVGVACNGSLNLNSGKPAGSGGTEQDAASSSGGSPVIPGTGGAVVITTGGVSGTGGVVGSGGTIGTGGVVSSGGTMGSGGVPRTGGATGSGGVMGTGGLAPGTCIVEADCTRISTNLHCDTAARTCVGCVAEGQGQCTIPPFLHCNTALRRCVECLVPAHCPGGTCAAVGNICLPGCPNDTDAECTLATANSCEDLFCTGCEDSQACAQNLACLLNVISGSSHGACVQCVTSSTCLANTPGTPFCDTATHRCVTCVMNSQCPPAMPVCDVTTGMCRLP